MLVGYLADPAFGPSSALVVVDLGGQAVARQIPAEGNVGLASWQRVH
jgi:hypothetical protein